MEKYANFNWLKNHLGLIKKDNKISAETEEVILKEVSERNDHALYTGFKAYMVNSAVFVIFLGLMLLIGDLLFNPADMFKEGYMEGIAKKMVIVPAVLGGLGYYLYLSQFRNSKLWKEVLVSFFYVTVSISFVGVLIAYEIDFINNKLIFLMILSFGLFLTYKHNSLLTAIAYLGTILVVVFGFNFLIQMVGIFSEIIYYSAGGRAAYELMDMQQGLYELSSLIHDKFSWLWQLTWLFLLAIIPFIKHRIDKANGLIGLKEAILGWVFVAAALVCALSINAGFGPLYITVVGVAIYLLSKNLYAKGTWFIYRPGSTAIVLFILYLSTLMAGKDYLKTILSYFIDYNNKWRVYNITGILFLILLAAITYIYYKKVIEKKGIRLNYNLLLFFPVMLLVDLLGASVGHYIMFAYLVYLCYTYVDFGLNNKYPAPIIIGILFGVGVVINKILLNAGEKITEDPSLTVFGILFIFIGLVYIGAIEYCRGRWNVTSQNIDDDHNYLDATTAQIKEINADELKSYGMQLKDDLVALGQNIVGFVSGNQSYSSQSDEGVYEEKAPSTPEKPVEDKNTSSAAADDQPKQDERHQGDSAYMPPSNPVQAEEASAQKPSTDDYESKQPSDDDQTENSENQADKDSADGKSNSDSDTYFTPPIPEDKKPENGGVQKTDDETGKNDESDEGTSEDEDDSNKEKE